MFMGLYKFQWLVLILILLAPLVVNMIGIWYGIDHYWLMQALRKGYYERGLIEKHLYYPWPNIIKAVLKIIPVGVLVWLVAAISNTAFFQGCSPKTRTALAIVIGLLIAAYLSNISIFISEAWIVEFREEGFYVGIWRSGLVYDWSWWLIFPLTTILVFFLPRLVRFRHQPQSDLKT